MRSPVALILHFHFLSAEDLVFWVVKHETEASALAKGAIQRLLIKTD